MSEADDLNTVLERDAPAIARCLSPLGRRAVFPRGIPFQAEQASHTEINATIGQLTDGLGSPMPLGPVAAALAGVDADMAFLYAPLDGPVAVRDAWRRRELRLAGNPDVQPARPFVSHGLTHALSLVAGLFADADTDVIVPAPSWGNYRLVFNMHSGSRIVTYPFFRDGQFSAEGLRRALASVRGKAIVVLNFPGNPTGYTPSADEVHGIVEVLTEHRGPAVVVLDDAYQGWTYEPGLMHRSLFWELAQAADPERLVPFKVDGATKELVFFSSRVGFLTWAGTSDAAEAALTSKLKFLVRGTVGCASGPALALVQQTLADPNLEQGFGARHAVLAARYRALREALALLPADKAVPYPFNSAFFALIGLPNGQDAEALRQKLVAEQSVGTIAFPDHNALRIAYCSIHERDLPELVRRIAAGLS